MRSDRLAPSLDMSSAAVPKATPKFSADELAASRHEKVRRVAALLNDPSVMDRIRAYNETYWDQAWDQTW